jgi:hypothetical protein
LNTNYKSRRPFTQPLIRSSTPTISRSVSEWLVMIRENSANIKLKKALSQLEDALVANKNLSGKVQIQDDALNRSAFANMVHASMPLPCCMTVFFIPLLHLLGFER